MVPEAVVGLQGIIAINDGNEVGDERTDLADSISPDLEEAARLLDGFYGEIGQSLYSAGQENTPARSRRPRGRYRFPNCLVQPPFYYTSLRFSLMMLKMLQRNV